MRNARHPDVTAVDALSAWATAPPAARAAGEEAFRYFETAEAAIAFVNQTAPGSDAERQRRRRARVRRGEIVVPTPICGTVLDALIDLQWLDEAAAADRAAIGNAVGAMLVDLAKHR